MHIKTGAVVLSLFGALVLTGCASSTPAAPPSTKATATTPSSLPLPLPTVVALSTGTSGKVSAAKHGTVAKTAQPRPKNDGTAAAKRVNRKAPTTFAQRIGRYMLAAANSQ